MGKPTNFVAALRQLVQHETRAQVRGLLHLPPRAIYERQARRWLRQVQGAAEKKLGTGR